MRPGHNDAARKCEWGESDEAKGRSGASRTTRLEQVRAVELRGDEAVLAAQLAEDGEAARGLSERGQGASVDAAERVAHRLRLLRPARGWRRQAKRVRPCGPALGVQP